MLPVGTPRRINSTSSIALERLYNLFYASTKLVELFTAAKMISRTSDTKGPEFPLVSLKSIWRLEPVQSVSFGSLYQDILSYHILS